MRKKTKLVHGWGINDVDYQVVIHAIVNGKRREIWRCPYYLKWKDILKRGCCALLKTKRPTYKGVTVCPEWKYLSNFIKWVDSQPNKDWENCEPDKDLLNVKNKIYSPDTVVFIGKRENQFTTDRSALRGKYMIGVSRSGSKKNPYQAQCSSPFTTERGHLGLFPTELEAHKAWQAKKHEHACALADLQDDCRVADALRQRYAPEKDWSQL